MSDFIRIATSLRDQPNSGHDNVEYLKALHQIGLELAEMIKNCHPPRLYDEWAMLLSGLEQHTLTEPLVEFLLRLLPTEQRERIRTTMPQYAVSTDMKQARERIAQLTTLLEDAAHQGKATVAWRCIQLGQQLPVPALIEQAGRNDDYALGTLSLLEQLYGLEVQQLHRQSTQLQEVQQRRRWVYWATDFVRRVKVLQQVTGSMTALSPRGSDLATQAAEIALEAKNLIDALFDGKAALLERLADAQAGLIAPELLIED